MEEETVPDISQTMFTEKNRQSITDIQSISGILSKCKETNTEYLGLDLLELQAWVPAVLL